MLPQDLSALKEMREVVAKAKEARKKLATYSQAQLDKIIAAMAQAGWEASETLARLATGETSMGRVESKTAKNRFACKEVYESIKDQKLIGLWPKDPDKPFYEVGEPVGTIAAIIPTTNPTSTTIFKALIALKAGNPICFAPHPRAKQCIKESARIMQQAAWQAGAPDGAISCLSHPTLEATQQLMSHPDVAVILATGGTGLVKAAYASGKPAFGVGAGNPPVYIHRSADIAHATRCIVSSQTFDNGTLCSSEQAILIDQSVYSQALKEFEKCQAYLLNEEQMQQVSRIALKNGLMNPALVGQSAQRIAELAGISVPVDTTVLLAPLTGVGKDFPLSFEVLAPVLAVYQVEHPAQAIELSQQLLALGGEGHTAGVHTTDEEVIAQFAEEVSVSRVIVNAPTSQGSVGFATLLMPSMTLGCGTFGNNITSDNISAEHLINKKHISAISPDFPLWEGQEMAEENTVIEISERPCSGQANLPRFMQQPQGVSVAVGNSQALSSQTPRKKGWPFNAI